MDESHLSRGSWYLRNILNILMCDSNSVIFFLIFVFLIVKSIIIIPSMHRRSWHLRNISHPWLHSDDRRHPAHVTFRYNQGDDDDYDDDDGAKMMIGQSYTQHNPNVFMLNCWMIDVIGSICLICFWCVFVNVSSNA